VAIKLYLSLEVPWALAHNVWEDHLIPKMVLKNGSLGSVPWLKYEVSKLYKEAIEQNHWLN
jgi:hypothetical protein